ncbi:MAG: tetratricopeptide repeat protein [Acetobacteraceae bacterium]|nr:tetratricopeptide repeat protein [Acetobacteraceae bacterium]
MPATFPHRLPDGSPYPSGTAYEVLSAVEHCRRLGHPDVYVFRHPNPPMVRLDDPEAERTQEQWERLKAFWETWFKGADGTFKSAFHEYTTIDDFDAQVDRLLSGWLEKILRARKVPWPFEIMGSPFRGLAAFGAKHARVFFGRARDTTRAVDSWKDAASRGMPFLLVVGASGAGKSSLARAGLVPRITASGVVPAVDLWRVAVMHPSEASDGPVASLARRLFDSDKDIPDDERGRPPALPEIEQSDYCTPGELARLFTEAGSAAIAPVTRALERAAEAERSRQGSSRQFRAQLLIVVDQLDELFAPNVAAEQRALFVRILTGLVETGQVWLLATLRADLYERFLAEPGLLALKTGGAAYDLSPPGPPELAEIVRKPAEAAGLAFETELTTGERLDERLLREADRPDMLPLLQLALDRLFEARVATADGAMLTVAAYENLGGLAGIINREAERAIIGLDQADIGRLPRLVRQLAAIGASDGTETSATPASLTTRRVSLADATPDAPSQRLVQALVEARILLTSGKEVAADVRLAHQRVLTDWARAREAVEASRRFLSIRKEVEDARQRWNAEGRKRDQLIQPGRSLNRAESILKDFGDELSPETLEFVRASGRRARLRQRLTAAAAVFFAALAFATGAAGIYAKRAEHRAEGSLDAARDAVNVIVVDIAQGLRYVAGVPTATIRTILEKIQGTVEDLTRFAPENVELSRVYLDSLREIAITLQTAGDTQGARHSALKALERAQELALRDPDDREWQHEISITLNRLGSIALSGGEAAEALKHDEEATAVMRRLTKADPNNRIWRHDLSISLDGIGEVKSQTGDARGALAAYDEGLTIIRTLAREYPDDPELRRQIAIRVIEIGDMKLSIGETAAAAADYQEGLTITRKLVEQNPSNTQWQRDVFFSLTKVGDLKTDMGDPTAAIASYKEAVDIVHHLVELDPSDPLLLFDEAEGLCKLGDVDLKEKDRDYQEGLTIMRRLVQRYPDNSRWQRELSVSLNKIGDIKLKGDDPDGAIPYYDEAVKIASGLAERDPENLVWLRDLAFSLSKVGDVKLYTRDANGAVANYERALQRLRALSEHDPNNTLRLEDLTVTLNKLGGAKLQTGDVSAAATAFEESLAVARRLAERDPDNTLWQSDLWLALNNVGDVKLRTSEANSAIPDYQEALAIIRRLSERDLNSTLWLNNMTARLSKLGDASLRAADPGAAAASYDEFQAIARLLSEHDPGNAQWRSALWYSLYKLGEAKLRLGDKDAAHDRYAEALTIIRRLAAEDADNAKQQTNLVINLCGIASFEDRSEREQTLNEALAVVERLRAANQLPPDKIGWPDQIRQMLTNGHEPG